ncbi:MAG TPA: ABC transporter ATP-binding protein [Elusimicrobia bacterium]|jgi:phospholipid/cholesterol/gamma-HCH transport system ATP-binding protein|nr:ABC transporter ATP-binding protein [Elusimicrobiota bacterium]
MDNLSAPIVLELENVYFTLDGEKVFAEFSLQIYAGEIFVIFAPSGSHKSDLLKLCIGLLKPSNGTVKFKGIDLNNIPSSELQKIRSQIGFVFQESALLSNMRIIDNLALPLRYHTNLDEESILAKVKEKMNLLEIVEYQNKFPAELTPNIKKRASIARALIMEPEIVFYDEPTAELDTLGGEIVSEIIKKVNENGITSIVATYNIPTVLRLAKRLAIIESAKISVFEHLEDVKDKLIAHLPKIK